MFVAEKVILLLVISLTAKEYMSKFELVDILALFRLRQSEPRI